MMEEAEQQPAVAAADEAAPAAAAVIDEAALADAWFAMAQSEAKAPRLSSTLAQAQPVLDGKDIHFEVANLAQQEWIERNCRQRLEAFLQRKLGDPTLRLRIDVKQAEDTGRGLYMPSDKAKYLQENSPEYNGLKKDFELEIS
jgi:chromosomal replication initiation ATPase DnaA